MEYYILRSPLTVARVMQHDGKVFVDSGCSRWLASKAYPVGERECLVQELLDDGYERAEVDEGRRVFAELERLRDSMLMAGPFECC